MESKTAFFITQIKKHLSQNNISYMIFQETDNPEYIGNKFTYRIYISIFGNSLGHSDVNIYTGEDKELVAISINEVSSALLNICSLLGEIYGVAYKRMELLNPIYNKYIFYF